MRKMFRSFQGGSVHLVWRRSRIASSAGSWDSWSRPSPHLRSSCHVQPGSRKNWPLSYSSSLVWPGKKAKFILWKDSWIGSQPLRFVPHFLFNQVEGKTQGLTQLLSMLLMSCSIVRRKDLGQEAHLTYFLESCSTGKKGWAKTYTYVLYYPPGRSKVTLSALQ